MTCIFSDSPLFIPLKTEYYEAFERGDKTVEYRLKNGRRWNDHACEIGRHVILSKGYGKKHRLHGVITGYATKHCADLPQDVAETMYKIYGRQDHCVACIEIGDIKRQKGSSHE